MRSRRGISAVVLAAALVTLSAATAGAASGVFQRVPASTTDLPGTAPFDGTGRYVYIAPSSPGAQQLPTTQYLYEHVFGFQGLGGGFVALARDASGPVAALQVDHTTVTIPYQWAPGRIYFLFAYHLGGGAWGAWVYDVTAASWTFVGQLQAQPGEGLLGPTSGAIVENAGGLRTGMDLFVGGGSAVPSCSWFPRVDVYWSPPIGFRGTAATMGDQTLTTLTIGSCPTTYSTEYGWTHHQLGVPATATS